MLEVMDNERNVYSKNFCTIIHIKLFSLFPLKLYYKQVSFFQFDFLVESLFYFIRQYFCNASKYFTIEKIKGFLMKKGNSLLFQPGIKYWNTKHIFFLISSFLSIFSVFAYFYLNFRSLKKNF